MPASRNASTKRRHQIPAHPYKPFRWEVLDDDYLQFIQPPITPSYFISDNEELKAIFLIRCRINSAIEFELVRCTEAPNRNHLVSITRRGVLEIECDDCNVHERCKFMSVWEEMYLRSAFDQWKIFAAQQRERDEYRRQFWELVREVEEERKG
ncbi:hypothetical protein K435DRAFT_873817 [Dendrothele bispora CBS 962.96]|uniref:Uncharacterized protein n=1 Tax=Dendrothele bispora (strain CBS 962.96) TaxID=1314807 RepID=A0A4S8KYN3_DENBC|nr:hypothetical protein K435DRAFT_873817 [Dendrothele bispora CBS 962.96]